MGKMTKELTSMHTNAIIFPSNSISALFYNSAYFCSPSSAINRSAAFMTATFTSRRSNP